MLSYLSITICHLPSDSVGGQNTAITSTRTGYPKKGMAHMATQNENKKKKKRTRPSYFLHTFAIISLTLIFVLLLVFFAGRAVARGSSEDLSRKLHIFLSDSPFAFAIPALYGDDIPDTAPTLPECVLSNSSGITVSFPDDTNSVTEIKLDNGNYSAHMYALKNPNRLFIGKSTQDHNHISGILSLENAALAFSASAAGKDKVLVYDKALTGEAEGGFFGITDKGFLVFGKLEDYKNEDGELVYAKSANVGSLIINSIPCDFSPSDLPFGSPALAIGQCADGSLLLIFTDSNASAADIAQIFYRYSAVNAAIVYVGNGAGVCYPDGTYFSYDEGFADAEFSSAWLIK